MAIDTKSRELEPSMWKAFDRKYSSCIRLWNMTMKNWFRHHLENFISFPLIYRFAGIRCVLTEIEANNWKHRSNYTVTLMMWAYQPSRGLVTEYIRRTHLTGKNRPISSLPARKQRMWISWCLQNLAHAWGRFGGKRADVFLSPRFFVGVWKASARRVCGPVAVFHFINCRCH